MPENAAFAQFYNIHIHTIYRFCAVRLKNATEAEDITQETFFRAMQHPEIWQSPDTEHARAWLLVTAANLCKNYTAHWSYAKRTTLSDWSEAMGISPPPDERESAVLEAVLQLPEQYKTVIYLFYYEGYSGAEIAEMLHKKESTVRSLLHRGRKQLSKYLGGEQHAKS